MADQGMPTYRNGKYGFEIDLPAGWAVSSGFSRVPVHLANVINRANVLEEFTNGRVEHLNIVVERMQPELPPDINELIFTLNARERGYTSVQFGRITVGGRVHAWASYVMNLKGWLKKYLIVLNGYGYALTASCPIERRSLEVEGTWDSIATSFRLLNPIDSSVIALNDSPQAQRLLEQLRNELLTQLLKQKRQ